MMGTEFNHKTQRQRQVTQSVFTMPPAIVKQLQALQISAPQCPTGCFLFLLFYQYPA